MKNKNWEYHVVVSFLRIYIRRHNVKTKKMQKWNEDSKEWVDLDGKFGSSVTPCICCNKEIMDALYKLVAHYYGN